MQNARDKPELAQMSYTDKYEQQQQQQLYAPRRDDTSEALSKAMSRHVKLREQWHTVFLRLDEFSMHGNAAEAMLDMRRTYAMRGDHAGIAAKEVEAQARSAGVLEQQQQQQQQE